MRITFIVPSIEIAGGIKSTIEIANRLTERGHDVCIVYPLIQGLFGARITNLRRLGGVTKMCVRYLLQGNTIKWVALKARLIRIPFLSEKFIPDGDVIVATWWADAYAIKAYNPTKGKKVYFIRHYEDWGGPKELVDKTYELPYHRIVTSLWLKHVIESKFNVETFGPIPNGIDHNVFFKDNHLFERHIPLRIGMMYRKDWWKGMETGLEALVRVAKIRDDIVYVLFGQNIKNEHVGFVKRLSSVEIHKMPYGESLRKIYGSLDIFVFPSYCEGFGNPPMEAMACGAAVVTTNVGAVPDYIIPGETAMVVPIANAIALMANIIELIDKEEKRKYIARVGCESSRQYNWDSTVAKLEAVLKHL